MRIAQYGAPDGHALGKAFFIVHLSGPRLSC
jgi:hypothetical protein